MGTTRAYHAPVGDPCSVATKMGDPCGLPPRRHRVDHIPDGEPCGRCAFPDVDHYKKAGQRTWDEKMYYVGIDGEGQGGHGDGEHRYVLLAWSNENGSRKAWIEADKGKQLSTEECLNFILKIPVAAKVFAFAFNYDLTKILQDVDDEALYYLFRADLRQRIGDAQKYGPWPVHWRDYKLNIHGSKFTVEHKKTGVKRIIWDVFKFYQAKFTTALDEWFKSEQPKCRRCKDAAEPCAVCRLYVKVKPQIERIREMKDKRHMFDKLARGQVRRYCFEECQFMAALTRKLVVAHEEAGLDLRVFHGAGSTAGAVLTRLGIKRTSKGADTPVDELLDAKEWRLKRNGPKEMRRAIAQAFFGGRFEHSVIGAIDGTIWGLDISSAYPYQLTFLPCLECGTWERTTNRADIDTARTALVRYSLDPAACPKDLVWGPFPFREPDGSIAFPSLSGGGWVWREEYREGERLFPHVRFQEAWVYKCTCAHTPFWEIPLFYVDRLRIGKEGPGIVIKLGCNACYGRISQSIGTNPPFQSWIWAGMITSGTRAQLLHLLGLHKDRRKALAMATDGMYTREKIEGPKPVETMTAVHWRAYEERLKDKLPDEWESELVRVRGLFAEKPLGGWERKRIDKGMFFARPGIYFPLNPSQEDVDKVRARGIGRKSLYDHWETCIKAYESRNILHLPKCAGAPCDCPFGVRITHVDRFHGAKSSISRRRLKPEEIAERRSRKDWGVSVRNGKKRKREPPIWDWAWEYARGAMLDERGSPVAGLTRKRYGQWSPRSIEMTFNPLPKRESINYKDNTLVMRSLPLTQESVPYKKSLHSKSLDAQALKAFAEEMNEQPGGDDWSEYDRLQEMLRG